MINSANLTVENAPPLEIPFRFFLTAPLFGILFALMLFLGGADWVESRWHPQLIGSLHLINIGVLMMVVTGVLFQILPVVGGVQFPFAGGISWWIHLALTAGAILYFLGFLWVDPLLIIAASVVIAVGLIPYLLLFLNILWRRSCPSEMICLLRYPALFLLLLSGLGVLLLMGWGGMEGGVRREWTDLHAIWGMGGWFTLLLMGMSFQMIPMFHVTPEFPLWLRRWSVMVAAVALLLWGAGEIVEWQRWSDPLLLLAALTFSVHAIFALRVLLQRKRKVFDVTVTFWMIGLSALLMGSLLLLLSRLFWGVTPPLLGVLWIFGFLLPMLSGALVKIAPFLVFLHLQQRVIGDPDQLHNLTKIPNLFQILPTQQAKILLLLYGLMALTGVGSLLFPVLLSFAALLMAGYFSWLLWLMVRCYRTYRSTLKAFGMEGGPSSGDAILHS